MPPAAASPPPKRSLKSVLFFIAKLSLAGGLVGWLVLSGQLDFRALKVLVERPELLALDLGLFGFGACVGSLRYKFLLRIASVDVAFAKLFQLQMTAFFFNVVIPGNIGGDVVKALYVARDVAPEKRTTILLLTFVERLLGVAALVLVGALVVLLRPAIWADPLLRPMGAAVLTIASATVVGGLVSLLVVRKLGHRLDAFTSGPSRISKLLNQLVASLRIVSQGPKQIAIALGLSMTFHAGGILFFTLLTQAILHVDTSFGAIATVFPLGLLSLLLPISPAGLGVGHIAFKRLFEAIGIKGGATVFNVYVLGQNTPTLLGVFPFLALKKRGELPNQSTAVDPAT